MQSENDGILAELMEQLIESGPDGMASAFIALMNLAMRMERERHLGAQAHARSPAPRPMRAHPRPGPCALARAQRSRQRLQAVQRQPPWPPCCLIAECC